MSLCTYRCLLGRTHLCKLYKACRAGVSITTALVLIFIKVPIATSKRIEDRLYALNRPSTPTR